MNHSKIYSQIIERAKDRTLTGYKESHHIVPKCIGGKDDLDNLVDLTPEEHYVCHQLLCRIYPDHKGIWYSALTMSMNNGKNGRSNKLYGWLKRGYASKLAHPCKIYDQQEGKWLSFESHRQAADHIGCNKSGVTELINGNRRAIYGRYTKDVIKKTHGTCIAIKLLDTLTNKVLNFESHKEAAEALGCSAPTVRGHINGLSKLLLKRYKAL